MKNIVVFMLFFFLVFPFFGATSTSAAKSFSHVELTKKEKAFIKAHPVITLGTEKDWEPYIVVNEDGSISGFDKGVLDKINELTGSNFQLLPGKWVEMQKKAKLRQIDGLSTGIAHEERKAYLNFSDVYSIIQKMMLVPLGNPKNIKSDRDLDGKIIAVHKGNMADEKLARSFKNSSVLECATIEEMIKAVVNNKADVTFGNGGTLFSANKLGLPYLQIAYPLGEYLKFVFGVRNDWPEAIGILNKGLAAIPEYEKNQLRRKWLVGDVNHDPYIDSLRFDADERAYLSGIDYISMSIDPSWMPYEQIDRKGQSTGITVDFMNLLSQRIGKDFRLIPTDSWEQTLSFARERKCDILPSAISTPTRREYLKFSSSYISFPLVVATALDKMFIDDFDSVADQTFAVTKGYAAIELLRNKYPNIKIIEVEDALTGLEKIHEEGVLGYIDTVPAISYQIQKNGMFDVKISGKLDLIYDLSVGVRNDRPQLLSILNKAIASISYEERQGILNRWISVHYDKGVDYSLVWKVLAVLVFFILLLLYRYNIISRYNKKLLLMNSKLDSLYKTDRLTQVFNRYMLDSEMERELARSVRYDTPFSVILLDIDYFKRVNDIYGHHAGDTVLVAISSLLSISVRETDVLGRWGGEEFLIICPETKLDGAVQLAEKLRGKIEELHFPVMKENVTASLGVAAYVKGETGEALIKRADAALYRAKDGSRNCVIVAKSGS
ncbi:polar amino acid transport system substrate-binding protein [Maridesulfovibrio ferrireducens]|uniref:diguanylate cyclase n=1 Tax=Maridesulfovibrio ferrireducens TaxID=246191 RepID=A0A1G9FU77_9BACT|nr:transporter substrate-binding domain-containing protein [Maridesulfovibrio ferrireducens]SDK91961.1 polar amino acid transport system substrate-binding protein [Maridesulfovibrio ferrireducens]